MTPAGAEVNPNYIKIGDKFVKSLFVFAYPSTVSSGWLDPLINQPNLFDISIFMEPVETATALKSLRRKSAQLESQIAENEQKGLVRDPLLETALQNVEDLRDVLQRAEEKMFSVGVYITLYADTLDEMAGLEGKVTKLMEGKMVYVKPAFFEQLEGFLSAMPFGNDHLNIRTPLNSGPVSSFFPFVSEDLTSDQGIMYGVNRHNQNLVIFDRFSLENANQVVFAKSGGGKSYATKLEIIRQLMMGVDVIVIDPENEYQRLAEAFGGSFFNISLTSPHHINPFDIPVVPQGEQPAEVLRSHIVNLAGLAKLMIGKVTPEEDALMDHALTEAYASREIVPGEDFSNATPPLLSDLETVLRNLEGGHGMAERLYKYTQGSFSGFLNQPTNVDIQNRLIVFSIRRAPPGRHVCGPELYLEPYPGQPQEAHTHHRRGLDNDEE